MDPQIPLAVCLLRFGGAFPEYLCPQHLLTHLNLPFEEKVDMKILWLKILVTLSKYKLGEAQSNFKPFLKSKFLLYSTNTVTSKQLRKKFYHLCNQTIEKICKHEKNQYQIN